MSKNKLTQDHIKCYQDGQSIVEIAEMSGLSRSSVQRWLNELGVSMRPSHRALGKPNKFKKPKKIKPKKAKIDISYKISSEDILLYERGELSLAKIAKQDKISTTSVKRQLIKNGVEIRGLNDAMKNYFRMKQLAR